MDYLNKFTGSGEQKGQASQTQPEKKQEGGFLGGIGDKFNSAAGGGKESEKNEDMLDKGPFAYYNYLIALTAKRFSQVSTSYKRSSSVKAIRATRYVQFQIPDSIGTISNFLTVSHRTGQGRADLRLHSKTVQEHRRK